METHRRNSWSLMWRIAPGGYLSWSRTLTLHGGAMLLSIALGNLVQL